MKNIKLKKILILVLWITVASSVVFILGFVNAQEKNTKGKSLNINITNQDENLFIDESDIIKFLKDRNDSLINQRFQDINVN